MRSCRPDFQAVSLTASAIKAPDREVEGIRNRVRVLDPTVVSSGVSTGGLGKAGGTSYQKNGMLGYGFDNETTRSSPLAASRQTLGTELMSESPRFKASGHELEKHSHSMIQSQELVSTWRQLCEQGQLVESVEALDLLVQQGCYVQRSLVYCVLKRCIGERDLVLGKRVHALAVKAGYQSNAFLANHIICMYASHGKLQEAMQVFSKVASPDRYMWASIILGNARHAQPAEAIHLYRRMRGSLVEPDNRIFVAILKACASATDLATGKEVHADITSSTVVPDMFVLSCLVDMYAKCGNLEDARRVFDTMATRDVVTWTAMIAGYADQGLGQEALALYAGMQQEGIAPNHITFASLLRACGGTGDLHLGKQLHSQILRKGLEMNVVVGNCLVDMYAKCGALQDARQVFNNLPTRDVVTWTAMISGYSQHGVGQEALTLYGEMERDGVSPANKVTFMCLLQACASVGALRQGKQLHAQIEERGLQADVVVGNCLVDMYVKCSRLDDARRVFDNLQTRNVVTWNALLNGYAQHNDSHMAMSSFQEMQQQGLEPDGVTFNCLLVACSHDGLVKEGQRYFKMMVETYGIAPDAYHYTCFVDLYARSGCLDEAETVLQTMPFKRDVTGWTSLLSACKSHGDIERGKRCFDQIMEIEPGHAPAYVLLANMYASVGKLGDAHRIECLRKFAGAKKKPGKAYIEVKNKVHEFTVGDERADISSKVRSVYTKLRSEGGHVPHTDLVLKGVSEREKEDGLCGHAEKLALAYGLLNTPDGTTLLVTKNLRMCNDCHSGTKIMSLLEKRQIVVRDAHCVHRFVDGSCSCGDRH